MILLLFRTWGEVAVFSSRATEGGRERKAEGKKEYRKRMVVPL